MAAVFATSIAGLFAWSTIVRLWLGQPDADRGRGSLASIGRTRFGWFGLAYGSFGLTGVLVIAAVLVTLVRSHTLLPRVTGGLRRERGCGLIQPF